MRFTLPFLLIMSFFMYQAHAMPRTIEELQSFSERVTETSVGYGQIPAIFEPRFLPVIDAALTMDHEEVVFIGFFPDGIRIFPQKIMVWHEVINGSSKGIEYCVTYSPLSGSVAIYNRKVDKVTLQFDNFGTLYNSNSVLIDRNTGSLWSQLLGMAFEGPMFGKGLGIYPVWWSTWRLASRFYPDAQVLMPPLTGRKAYGRDPYGSYRTPGNYYDDERIMYPLTLPPDARLHPKQRVLGLEKDGFMLAVDEHYVRQKKVVNFFLGPSELVAFVDPRLDVVRVFERNVWNKPMIFRLEEGQLVDRETETSWNFDGQAELGPLQGASMDELIGIYAFWFAWAAFHPETLLIPGDSEVPESATRRF